VIESQNPEVDLLGLQERISQDMTRGRLDDPGFTVSLDDADLIAAYPRPVRSSLPSYVAAPIQPTFVADPAGHYRVNDLMAFHDATFISVAFESILGRKPDPQGFRHYLSKLHQGDSKAEILGEMLASAEGQSRGAQVKGLELRYRLARIGRLPFIGKLAQIAMAVWQLPGSLRNQKKFEDYTVSALEQDAAVFEHLERRLARQRTRLELIRGAVSRERVKLAQLERAGKVERKKEELQRREGAYLPLLKQAGIPALELEQDPVACLLRLEANSQGAIIAFQRVEQLPFKVLTTMVDQSLRVLKPGGVMIVETPSPSALAALLDARGFSKVSVGPQDESVIGWKPTG